MDEREKIREIKKALIEDADFALQVIQDMNSYDGRYPQLDMFEFDEEFFRMMFSENPYEAARATYFGEIESWSDDWIGFNGYGNLISMSQWQIEREAIDLAKSEGDEMAEYVMENTYLLPDELASKLGITSLSKKPVRKRNAKNCRKCTSKKSLLSKFRK